MKKRQKIWIVVLLALLAAAAVFFALFGSGGKDDAPQTGNLIVNGDFALTTDGEPDGWQTGAGDERGRFVSGGGDAGGRHDRRAGGKRRGQRRAL